MAEGRSEYNDRLKWNHTSSLMAITNNVHAIRDSQLKKPADFNPYMKKSRGIPLDRESIHMLKQFARKGRGLKRA